MAQRFQVSINGCVQGIGFRPFLFNFANQKHLTGWVQNSNCGVKLEIQSNSLNIDDFISELKANIPRPGFIDKVFAEPIPIKNDKSFTILPSEEINIGNTITPVDLATCDDCLKELSDPKNRRYQYPFITCTQCGPRASLTESLPFDRKNTSMNPFNLCYTCSIEYHDPKNRRFYCQTISCWDCGPKLIYKNLQGLEAIKQTAREILEDKIVAVKSVGGFQLLANALSSKAINKLRERKRRKSKPFAVMFPTLKSLLEYSEPNEKEIELLKSSQSPIVLIKKSVQPLAQEVSPNNPNWGAFLPFTPIHHLLLKELQIPVVATSGNFSDEPICTDDGTAQNDLRDIADGFLIHNRKITRVMDDSIVRVISGKPQVLRRARGLSSIPLKLNENVKHPILAVGAQLKNTVALGTENQITMSQHIGDLTTKPTFNLFTQTINDLCKTSKVEPEIYICDMHPNYFSHTYATKADKKTHYVQHHIAHMFSCIAEHSLKGPVFGVVWDGTGFGPDGTIWGGEFFNYDGKQVSRFASLKQFVLPGGEKAIKDTWRCALGLLYEIHGPKAFDFYPELSQIDRDILLKNINCPRTSSMGRLFDGVSSLLGICNEIDYEGEAAMKLEYVIQENTTHESYKFSINKKEIWSCDYTELIKCILKDIKNNISKPIISQKFHNALVNLIVEMAEKAQFPQVVLSGGCFQNAYLLECSIKALREKGFKPYWNQIFPPNDEGISLGQIEAFRRL